ncbi:uncharacterized protein LOC134805268 [Cydia splendana]|uniref:uncharacterized protein LOC134805268 n=1 Tax=Cydia splendana TaxID=1100963 RepID=UPI00300C9BAF
MAREPEKFSIFPSKALICNFGNFGKTGCGVPDTPEAAAKACFLFCKRDLTALTFESNIATKKGVRQGCILSPMLFNIYGEYIVRKSLEGWHKGFAVGGKRINNLRYADDTVLLASSISDMQELVNRLEVESGKLGLAINRSKTKLMIVDRAGRLSAAPTIQGIDTVDEFVYLGSKICNDGSCVPEIKRRIGMAKDAMTRLQKIWRSKNNMYGT